MRLIDADALCKDLIERWNLAETRKEELIRAVMADIVTPIVVSQPTIEQSQWIPCRERLPKYGQPVLTYNLEDDEYEVNHIIDEEDGEWFTYGVDAWQPLPAPYQPKEDKS